MELPNPRAAHKFAVNAASIARIAASVMGGGITDATSKSLALALACANAGRFRDAYREVDVLSDKQTAWVPVMMVLRLAQATFGNEAGLAGEPAPCEVCGADKPPVFDGARICLGCAGAPASIKLETVKQV